MVSANEDAAVARPVAGQQPYGMADGPANSTKGQRHDRILPYHDAASVPLPVSESQPENGTPASNGRSTGPIDQVTIAGKMLSAVAGSFITSVLVTPLDVVRVRLQSQHPPPSFSEIRLNGSAPFPRSFNNLPPNLGVTACCREVFWVTNNTPYCVVEGTLPTINPSASAANPAAADCAVEETQRRAFTSTLDGLRKIARNEGVTTLWRGLSPTLVMAVPGNVIYFAGYDWLRTSPASPLFRRVNDAYSPLVAGSIARVIAAFFVSPIELFRTRMQASQNPGGAAENFYETSRGVREMVANQGVRSLWRGLSLTLWRDVPFSALYWWGYEFTRNAMTDAREHGLSSLMNRSRGTMEMADDVDSRRSRASSRNRQNHTSTMLDSFAAGALSGGIASVITTPFDVGKTRQQVFRYSGDSIPASAGTMASGESSAVQSSIRFEDRSMPRLLWHIFKEEGMAGLFRGCAARVLKVSPACAIMISSYEIGKKMAAGIADQDRE